MSSDYLFTDHKSPSLDHPDSCIRLACAVHRFKVPKITRKVTFASSFSTVGQADKTRKLMLNADSQRQRLDDALSSKKISSERVLSESKRYQPMIHSILLSCKVQPEEARLDERLIFAWSSGVEENPKAFKSEAIMYDLVLTVASEGLGRATSATENSVAGEFAAASRDYAAAAGVFQFLADDHLPKWISKGSKVNEEQLPAECHAPFAKALSHLFMANGQQMAVATVLIKPGQPNYSLLAKLCLGISEQLDGFVSKLRKEAFHQMSRLDPDFFILISFQINLQKSLSLYFQARDLWNKTEYGNAIALLSDATVALRTRDSESGEGVPEIARTPLKVLKEDLEDLRTHMAVMLRQWEKDNSSVFFHSVPQYVAAGKKLQEGYLMNKATPYALEEAEPVLLQLPEGALQRSDSDLARELQEKLNTEEHEEEYHL
jgi:BRO1-like domain